VAKASSALLLLLLLLKEAEEKDEAVRGARHRCEDALWEGRKTGRRSRRRPDESMVVAAAADAAATAAAAGGRVVVECLRLEWDDDAEQCLKRRRSGGSLSKLSPYGDGARKWQPKHFDTGKWASCCLYGWWWVDV